MGAFDSEIDTALPDGANVTKGTLRTFLKKLIGRDGSGNVQNGTAAAQAALHNSGDGSNDGSTWQRNGIIIEDTNPTNARKWALFASGLGGSGALLQLYDYTVVALRLAFTPAGAMLLGGLTAGPAGYAGAGDVALPATGKVRALNTAKAWVTFDGATGAIRGSSFNVTSVGRTSAGTYTVNLANALPDTNGVAIGNAVNSALASIGDVNQWCTCCITSTTQVAVRAVDVSNVTVDVSHVSIVVFSA